jgi:hypothetical protein
VAGDSAVARPTVQRYFDVLVDTLIGAWLPHVKVREVTHPKFYLFDQDSGAPTVVFQQDGEKLTGTYTGQMGQYPLEGTFTDKKIAFTVSVNMQGNEIALVYTGTLEADGTLKGTVDLGGMASGTWTGKKTGGRRVSTSALTTPNSGT